MNKKYKQNTNNTVERQAWGAKIDPRLKDELKFLSVVLKTPVYQLAEEAIHSLIKKKRRMLEKQKLKASKM